MNVLVTGGAGYIGSVCVEELCNAGHSVTVFDNLSEGHRDAVDPRARFVVADLCDLVAIRGALKSSGAEAVMHFAANALVAESMANPSKYFRNNVAHGINLLQACVETGIRKLVFSSTCATYGMPDVIPINESTPQRPVNPYGQSKLMVEQMLVWYRQLHGLDSVCLRYFNAAGASKNYGEDHRIETHLIPNFLRVALNQKAGADIFGVDYPTPDGTCIRDYVHIADIAQAHILALAPGKSGAYNLGVGGGFSVRQVLQTCEAVSGKSILVHERPRRAGDPPKLIASPDRARDELGWTPRFTTLESIVQSAWDWHVAHPFGYASKR